MSQFRNYHQRCSMGRVHTASRVGISWRGHTQPACGPPCLAWKSAVPPSWRRHASFRPRIIYLKRIVAPYVFIAPHPVTIQHNPTHHQPTRHPPSGRHTNSGNPSNPFRGRRPRGFEGYLCRPTPSVEGPGGAFGLAPPCRHPRLPCVELECSPSLLSFPRG